MFLRRSRSNIDNNDNKHNQQIQQPIIVNATSIMVGEFNTACYSSYEDHEDHNNDNEISHNNRMDLDSTPINFNNNSSRINKSYQRMESYLSNDSTNISNSEISSEEEERRGMMIPIPMSSSSSPSSSRQQRSQSLFLKKQSSTLFRRRFSSSNSTCSNSTRSNFNSNNHNTLLSVSSSSPSRFFSRRKRQQQSSSSSLIMRTTSNDSNDSNNNKESYQQQQQQENNDNPLSISCNSSECFSMTPTSATTSSSIRSNIISLSSSLEDNDDKMSDSNDNNNKCYIESDDEHDHNIDEPDMYGQVHPHETKELIQQSLKQFEIELQAMPKDVSYYAYLAEEKAIDTVSDEFKLIFLRTEVYRVTQAVKRYTLYWNKRVLLFGIDRAFQPLIFSNLTASEQSIVIAGHMSIIRKDDDQQHEQSYHHRNGNNNESTTNNIKTRDILFVNYGKFDKQTMSNLDFTRAMWYLYHCIIDDVNTQKYGVIYIATTKTFHFTQLPNQTFMKLHTSFFKDCVPVRLSAFHVLYPPSIIKMIYPIIILSLNERIRKRILIYTDIKTSDAIINRLYNKYNIPLYMIPNEVGGSYNINMMEWTEQQRLNGK